MKLPNALNTIDGLCATCHGDGKCNNCHGSGVNTHFNDEEPKCQNCAGTGVCATCGGTGSYKSEPQILDMGLNR